MKEQIALLSILVNLLLAGGKLLVGFWVGSGAVFAEGLHSGIDILSSIISFIGINIAKKPIDKKHPYGHDKYEVLAGLLITVILFLTGLYIIKQAIHELNSPSFINTSHLALGVMLGSAVVNEVISRLKIYYGKKENSIALLSDGVHSRIDVFISLTVMLGLFFARYWIYTDSLLAMFIGLYIIKESIFLGKEAAESLLDVSANEETEKQIMSILKKEKIKLTSLKTQKKGSSVSANLEINLSPNLKVEEATRISQNLRKNLMKEIDSLKYINIQIESHDVETGFYQPGIGRGFGWQKSGYCQCPKCDYKIIHKRGQPCFTLTCPYCKINLQRNNYAKT